MDTGTCSIVATKTYKYNEAALNQNHSVAHVITFLKFKTYGWLNIVKVHVIDLLVCTLFGSDAATEIANHIATWVRSNFSVLVALLSFLADFYRIIS